MSDIYWILIEVFYTGWLSLESEQKIREEFDSKPTWSGKDIELLDDLRQAIEGGLIRREASEITQDLS
ncbi:MAG: hypothetical protein KME07_07115 [Pegethrix bostrychoides GSE-TBD4-15B]|jgi:hypothetical protein|uniref:Uncharacterized protein n=1 Tax=Pegethrix bostrychoides GSE-TBD4-15B TaxID=2839662 RepID=A0A951P9M3_9CYAN|nr:hypothetical protein [Pegethrix bostrychoides GSE-TBD4-15B]